MSIPWYKTARRGAPGLLAGTLIWILTCAPAFPLTVEEAVSLARKNLPSYRAAAVRVKSTEALYTASLGPYLPSLDASTAQQRVFTSSGDVGTRNYDVTLSYTLFDGGKRRANRDIAFLNLSSDREELRKNLIDLEYTVKSSFYTALAKKETLEQRKVQLLDSQRDFDAAEGRYKFGVAKLSDVLQASVRLEQARFNLAQAEGDLNKALSDVESLTGYPLGSRPELQGSLTADTGPPDINRLSDAALGRPEIKQAENSLEIADRSRSVARSAFFPVVSAQATYSKFAGGSSGGLTSASASGSASAGSTAGFGAGSASSGIFAPEQKIAGLTATWNIFELGKFFRYSSSGYERDRSRENLNELKRQALLNVRKAYEDSVTASSQLKVAQQQLKQAGYNYDQALGEYKVGKADIISLVQAESQLSNAREQLVNSRLSLILSRLSLERAAGISYSPASPSTDGM